MSTKDVPPTTDTEEEIKEAIREAEAREAEILKEHARFLVEYENSGATEEEKRVTLEELNTPQGKVEVARARYIPGYLRTKKEMSKIRKIRTALFGNENHFKELSLNAEVNVTHQYTERKKEYDQARIVWGKDLCEKREADLRAVVPALTETEITENLTQYRDAVVRTKTIVEEREILASTQAEGIPVEPTQWKKVADWYVKQPRGKKLAINTILFSAAAVAGSTLGIIGSLGGAAGVATMAGSRFLKGYVGGTLSGLATCGVKRLFEKGFNPAFERKQSITKEELNKKFADGTMGLEEYEKNIDALEEKKKSRERNQARFKLGIGILVGGLASYGIAHASVGHGINNENLASQPHHSTNETHTSGQSRPSADPYNKQSAPTPEPKAPPIPEQTPAPVPKPAPEGEGTGGQQQTTDVAPKAPPSATVTHPAINETSTVNHSAPRQTHPEEITEKVTDAPESQFRLPPQEVPAGVTSEQIFIGQNQELVEATKQLHEMEIDGTADTDPVGYQELQQHIKELRGHVNQDYPTIDGQPVNPESTDPTSIDVQIPTRVLGIHLNDRLTGRSFTINTEAELKHAIDYREIDGVKLSEENLTVLKKSYDWEMTVKRIPTAERIENNPMNPSTLVDHVATPGFPIIIQTDSGDFRIENIDQLKYTIDHPIIHGQQFPDRELAELEQFYNKQLQVITPTPAAAPIPEAVVPRPTVGSETPPTTSTMDPIFKSPEHQLRTMHDVESQYRSHDFITEKPSGHIHGGTYDSWHHANDQMFALPDNNFKFNSYEEYAQTKTLQDIFGGSRSIDGTHQPLYYANQNFRPHWREVLHMPAKDLMHFKTSDLADMAKHRDPTLQRLLETGLVKNVNIGVGKPLYEFAFEVKELERLQHMMVKILGPTHGGPYTTPPENIEQYIERATKLGIRETEDGHLYWEIKIAYTQGQVPHRGHGQPFNIYPSEQGKVGQGNWNNGGIRNMAPLDGFWRDGFKPDDQNGFSTPVPMTNRWW
jgi:cytoskeletal protein RodZ